MKKAVVFYSRDFLSTEFPKLKKYFLDYKRIYVVCSSNEKKNVKNLDKESIVYNIHEKFGNQSDIKIDFNTFNNDRFLRNYSNKEIKEIITTIINITNEINNTFSVKFYLDEPVSGFPNFFFNTEFKKNGCLCMHFQPSWVPNLLYFVTDSAQLDPIKVNITQNGDEIVNNHVEDRNIGKSKPTYVINYSSINKRIYDIILNSLKLFYRVLFKKKQYYLDADVSAHLIHIKCLYLSIFKKYSLDPIKSLNYKYVLFPLHYEPESVLNYFSKYTRQEEIASQILDTLPMGYKLILKEHPSQPGALHLNKWDDLRKSKRVVLLKGKYNTKSLFDNLNVCVVSIGSTMALEAALYGKLVGVLGDVHFSNAPGIYKLNSPKDWTSLIGNETASPQEIKKWYSKFINDYCIKGNIMKDNTILNDFDKFLKNL